MMERPIPTFAGAGDEADMACSSCMFPVLFAYDICAYDLRRLGFHPGLPSPFEWLCAVAEPDPKLDIEASLGLVSDRQNPMRT
jgi:hypothetical protein